MGRLFEPPLALRLLRTEPLAPGTAIATTTAIAPIALRMILNQLGSTAPAMANLPISVYPKFTKRMAVLRLGHNTQA